jgi:tRNA(Glu) U13 pseudouridine synthase TruD
MINTLIYFGTDIKNKSVVSDKQFNSFLDTELANEVEGFSVSEITGYWKGTKEKTKVVSILHEKNDVNYINVVNKVALKYKTKFEQDSVLITRQEPNSVDFI